MSYGVDEFLARRNEYDAELRKHKSPVTVMFTDLAGSTAFFERHGDTVGMKWIEEHYSIILPVVEQYGGEVVKTIGDSVMAYFTEPKKAVDAAIAIERGIHGSNAQRSSGEPMYVRVALHHGLAYLRGGDVFGDVVNMTARIAKACVPAQILVSEALYLSAHEAAKAEFRLCGEFRFHGKSAAESLYEIVWADEKTYSELRQKFPIKQQARPEESAEGRYTILAELGRGAMGVVYKVYDRVIGRVVAMKTIPVEMEPGPEYHMLLDRLKQEARTAGMLDHPNIITVFDVGEEAGLFYFTMQYVEGRTLDSLRQNKELLPLVQALDIAEQLCSALAFAHQAGIIHRDIKPSNLMITAQGTLKVMDFGIAKLGDMGLTKAGMVLGTPSYLAPEQAAGRRVDQRADIFSVGGVLYELLTGEKAFPGESTTSILFKVLNEDPIPPRIIEPSLSPALDAIVRKALAKDPNLRFQDCEALRQAIRAARENRAPTAGIAAAMPIPAPVSGKLSSKGRLPYVAAGISVAVLGSAITFLALKRSPSSQPSPTTPAAEILPKPAVPAPPPAAPGSAAATETSTGDIRPPAAEEKSHAAKESSPKTREKTRQVRDAVEVEKARGARDKSAAAPATTAAQKENVSGPRSSGMWSPEDVPDLLAKAGAYAGDGEYDKAILVYKEVLQVDPQNRAAREGLHRAQEARGIHR
ncbi:MAG: protein kinase domain-containing protein [Terriglobales bacterium]